MVGETNSMVGYDLMAEDHSIQFVIWGVLWRFLKKFLNIGLKKMFEKLKIDTF